MRVTLIADNTDVTNWGCRATSFALRRLLARHHSIVHVVGRRQLSTPLSHSPVLPNKLYGKALRRLTRNKRSTALAFARPFGEYRAWTHDLDANEAALQRMRRGSSEASRMLDAIEDCDAVVVNGEGEMIFSSPARPTLLATLTLINAARKRGKPVFYTNGMVSACPSSGTNAETVSVASAVLADAQTTWRDPMSHEFAGQVLPGIKASWAPDALFSWADYLPIDTNGTDIGEHLRPLLEKTRHSVPDLRPLEYVVVSGSSSAAKSPERATQSYAALLTALKSAGYRTIAVPTCKGDKFLVKSAQLAGVPHVPVDFPVVAGAILLANAAAMVSGRWHPSIMASLGGVPTVMLGSNSHKSQVLPVLVREEELPVYSDQPDDTEIAKIVETVRKDVDAGAMLRDAIRDRSNELGKLAAKGVATIG